MIKREKTNFFIVGIAVASVATLLLVMRIISGLIYDVMAETGMAEWSVDLIMDAVFTIPLQTIVCVLVPFLIYKFGMKMSFKKVFAYSNFRKTKPINLLLAALIGLAIFFVTSGVSSIWMMLLQSLGYTYSSAATVLPDKFNVGVLIANLLLSAVLPAFCEEFFNRGAFLTTLREHFPTLTVVLFCGVGFGLFHENITQVFYTACFGMLVSFIVIKTNSIYPAMVIHFMNNALSMCLMFCDTYLTGSVKTSFDAIFNGPGFTVLFIVSIPVTVVLVYALVNVNRTTDGAVSPPVYPIRRYVWVDFQTGKRIDDEIHYDEVGKQVIYDVDPFDDTTDIFGQPRVRIDPFDGTAHTGRRKMYLTGRPEKAKGFYARRGERWIRVLGSELKKYETVFWIGAIVVSSLATVFSLVWGFMI